MLHTDNPDHMTSDHITKDRVTEWSPYCTNTLSAPQVEGNILIYHRMASHNSSCNGFDCGDT